MGRRIYVKAGLEKDKAALLIIIGDSPMGRKYFLPVRVDTGRARNPGAAFLEKPDQSGLKLGRLTIADRPPRNMVCLGEIHLEEKSRGCWKP